MRRQEAAGDVETKKLKMRYEIGRWTVRLHLGPRFMPRVCQEAKSERFPSMMTGRC